ncbi:hypothetical protein [Thermus tengchongensis]|uniref:Uncharacterized protein n=1 Tax=Thermus tengchongensis TaxID=1214928 RepID=A0A4Y9FFK1_9DEIN|nr:hypothetical protein [Thermus tengchongensis]TFU27672.1 hypothetical protein E0687_00355 [Thermus tengchongensis]
MEPGFHLLYARRLAWRHRLLLALPLALLGFLHPFFALASLLPFLLPARLWEGRALQEIARTSLAYPTALAYGEERLWQEARRVPMKLPPFPSGLLLAYLLALLLALALAAWRSSAGPGSPWTLPGSERPLGPERAPSPSGGAEGQEKPGEPPQGPAKAPPPRPGEAPSAGQPSPQGPQENPGPGTPSPNASGNPSPGGGTYPSPPGRAEGSPGRAEGLGAGRETSPSQEGPGEAAPKGPGTSGPGPQVAGPTLSPPPEAKGRGEGLLQPGVEVGAAPLPSPWGQGQPPKAVRRGVEVYLERTPLSPEARELLQRYFSAP